MRTFRQLRPCIAIGKVDCRDTGQIKHWAARQGTYMHRSIRIAVLSLLIVYPLISQVKYLEKDQTLLGFSLGYAHIEQFDAQSMEIGLSQKGNVAVSVSYGQSNPGHLSILGVGLDGGLIKPTAESPLGLSLQGGVLRAWVPSTKPLRSAGSVFVGLESYLRGSDEDFNVIPFFQITRSYVFSRVPDNAESRSSTGFTLGIDLLLFRLSSTGATMGAAFTTAEGEAGYVVSMSLLFLGRRGPS